LFSNSFEEMENSNSKESKVVGTSFEKTGDVYMLAQCTKLLGTLWASINVFAITKCQFFVYCLDRMVLEISDYIKGLILLPLVLCNGGQK